ncbi:hypothetical protein OROGR_024320 [Orobanche gracilis]
MFVRKIHVEIPPAASPNFNPFRRTMCTFENGSRGSWMVPFKIHCGHIYFVDGCRQFAADNKLKH